ncbi:MAG TPA: hypothetical protein VMB21_00860 [Candidatus Limnocylindria bacterium]|nr:hypothetical protein [Candidatus Limnocylindria bacterium]
MEKSATNVGQFGGGHSLALRIRDQSAEWKLHWLLRVGVAMEFLGHGGCGLHTKAGWLPYFHVFAIPDALAWKLMPWVGALDVALGLATLLAPRRALLLYMAVWGAFTALLRPAAGEGGWEFIERAYNYGVPFSLLLLHGFGRGGKSWWATLRTVPPLAADRARTLLWILRAIVALMLIGHGAFGAFMGKPNLLTFYGAAGLGGFGLPLETIRAGIGFFEIGLGVAALFATRPAFFAGICAWKLGSELLFLVAGANLACWEVVERGSSYVAPLAALGALVYLSPRRLPA